MQLIVLHFPPFKRGLPLKISWYDQTTSKLWIKGENELHGAFYVFTSKQNDAHTIDEQLYCVYAVWPFVNITITLIDACQGDTQSLYCTAISLTTKGQNYLWF